MGRRRVAALVTSVAAVVLWGALHAPGASAAAPVKYGWWNEANLGLGVSPNPPQAPSDGMYVQNVAGGPAAIAAVTFDVPPGAAIGVITLRLTGQPTISSPPFACPITAAGLGYKAAEGGPWSDAPKYDCSRAKVTGTVSPDGTTLTFDAGPLLADGVVAAVLQAGGPNDQIPISKPAADALSVTPAGAGTGSPAGPSSVASDPSSAGVGAAEVLPGSQPIGSASVAPSSAGAGPTAAAPSLAPSVDPPAPAAVPAGAAAPGAIPSAPAAQVSASTPRSLGGATRASARRPAPATAWKVVALLGLIGLLAAYTGGYGLLGARPAGSAGPDRPPRRLQPAVGGASSEA